MDGNGRWATKRHLPRIAGHKAGVNALRRTLECAVDEHIEMLSVYAFSTENWGRPRVEVEGLMRLFWETIRSDIAKLHREGVRLRHLGRLKDLRSEEHTSELQSPVHLVCRLLLEKKKKKKKNYQTKTQTHMTHQQL